MAQSSYSASSEKGGHLVIMSRQGKGVSINSKFSSEKWLIHNLCLRVVCTEFQGDSQVRILINVLCQELLAYIFVGKSNINQISVCQTCALPKCLHKLIVNLDITKGKIF